MQKQKMQEFLAIFEAAYPNLNREDRYALAEMAKLWASRNAAKPALRLVVSGATSGAALSQKAG